MATPPFAGPFEASLKTPPQGGILELLSGHVVFPQFFCCVSGNSVGVDKAPVAVIQIAVICVLTGAPVCINILDSWSPTDTLATWAVNWGDGNNNNGAWPPAGVVCHPLGGYAAADVYDVTLTVTDSVAPVPATDADIVQIIVTVAPLGPGECL